MNYDRNFQPLDMDAFLDVPLALHLSYDVLNNMFVDRQRISPVRYMVSLKSVGEKHIKKRLQKHGN